MAKTTPLDRALRAVERSQYVLNSLEAKAAEASRKRDEAVLAAQIAGAQYVDLERALNLSTSRVTQILRRARGLTTDQQ